MVSLEAASHVIDFNVPLWDVFIGTECDFRKNCSANFLTSMDYCQLFFFTTMFRFENVELNISIPILKLRWNFAFELENVFSLGILQNEGFWFQSYLVL